MVDIVLLVGKFLLLALVYLFLLAAVRAGVGLVARGGAKRDAGISLKIVDGPKALKGISVPVAGPVMIGRSPGADIVIADTFVSTQHARVAPLSDSSVVVEDLGSTNGTVVNGSRITAPTELRQGDEILLGTVRLKVVST